MMHIVYFSQKEQLFTEIEKIPGEKIFVTPSPAKADNLRTRLNSGGTEDVITIAKFTSNLVELLWVGEEKPQLKRKSELLLTFGILRNKYLPELSYEEFSQAYNLFSDLRSFSLNIDALSLVLDEQPEIIRNSIKLFWNLLGITGYVDEHGAYQMISERLRSLPETPNIKKTYIFWGFQHLNGQQIDLLRALGSHCHLIVPFPLALKEKIKKSDWISWIRDSLTNEKELPVLEINPNASWLSINSREISRNLKSLLKDGDQVLLGVSKLSASHLNMVPSQNVNFKIPLEILSNELNEIQEEIKKNTGNHSELLKFLEQKLKSPKSLKHLRALQLYKEALEAVTEMTDESIPVDSFFLKVLSEVTILNQPRTSYIPLSNEKMLIDLKDVSSVEDIDQRRRVIICIDDRFDGIQGMNQKYTESILKSLSSIGPIKRNELDLLFKQWEFNNLFSQAEVLVLMNEEILRHNLIWKRIFSEISLNKVDKVIHNSQKKLSDPLADLERIQFNGSLSASKIQTFIDCPRKFYFGFVDKIFPQIIPEKDFDSMTSGTIIHEVIEKFFKDNAQDDDLNSIVKSVMQSHIVKKSLSIPNEVYLQRELIFNHRARNGINFIRQIDNTLNEKISWKIEETFKLQSKATLNGRIDCLGVSSKHLFLLDFKSTEYSASSTKEVVDLDAIQLWTYAVASKYFVPQFENKTVVMGYVILDDPSKSILLTSDEKYFDLIKELALCKVHKIKEDFTNKISEAENKLEIYIQNILDERIYPPRPRKKSTCDYCELGKVCIKSEINHV